MPGREEKETSEWERCCWKNKQKMYRANAASVSGLQWKRKKMKGLPGRATGAIVNNANLKHWLLLLANWLTPSQHHAVEDPRQREHANYKRCTLAKRFYSSKTTNLICVFQNPLLKTFKNVADECTECVKWQTSEGVFVLDKVDRLVLSFFPTSSSSNTDNSNKPCK